MDGVSTKGLRPTSKFWRNFLIFALGVVVLGGLFSWPLFLVNRTYLICVDPAPLIATINDQKQNMSANGCFVYSGWYGQDQLSLTFQDGTQRKLRLYPRLADDNSTVVKVTPTSVVVYGDLRYKVE